MTGPSDRPRGRRNNGLDAPEFVALGDLDPRIGEHLLDVLALAGIAAYLAPSADVNPIIRSTVLPSRPTDRLWVDREHADQARRLMSQIETEDGRDAGQAVADARAAAAADEKTVDSDLGTSKTDAADGPELDVDAAWAQIVADFDAPTGAAAPSWPSIEDTSPGDRDTGSTPAGLIRADHLNPLGPPTGGPRDHTLAEAHDDDLTDAERGFGPDDEGYTPPPPPPMPQPSKFAVVGTLAVLVGFLLFFRPSLLPVGERLAMVLGALGVLGGSALLIYRLRDGLSSDDPDDGAVV